MKKGQFSFLLGLLVLMLILAACSSLKEQQAANEPEITAKESNQGPKILFLNIDLVAKSDSTIASISIADKLIVDGHLKQDFENHINWQENHLICSFLDQNQQLIRSTSMESPLHKVYEYKDEKGNLKAKEVFLDKATLSLRTQMSSSIRYLKIEKILADKQIKHLRTFEL